MSKNIVLCCDGTANQFAEDKTNVIKLYSVLQQDPASQVTYYHPGIGTMEPSGALTPVSRSITKILEQAVGWGLEYDIRDAYAFLMQTFEPEDKVFLFGFSRGAYTVRAVASLLHMYGLIRPGNEPLVPYAIRMMMGIQRANRLPQGQREDVQLKTYFTLAEQFRATMCRTDCKPWFVGVWDTVSSVGWLDNPLKLPYSANNPDIQIGRHAVSIDEHRAFFRSNLWIRPDPPNPGVPCGPVDMQQVWFPGVHCDVGGGYPDCGLSQIALEWMIAEAKLHDLKVDDGKVADVLGLAPGSHNQPPDYNGTLHNSLTGLWNIAEFIPKKHYDYTTQKTSWRANRYRRRTIPPQSLVHESAFLRKGDYKACLPPDAIMVSTPKS